MIIELQKINKSYESGLHGPAGNIHVLRDVSLTVGEGEFLCLIGPSGCGKSTLLKIIAGLEMIDSGTVTLPTELSMVFQSSALLPWLTAHDNVALGLRAKNVNSKKMSEKDVERTTKKFLDMMGLGGMGDKYPRELSGGQKQRVGLARALAVEPKVLLLDEPFSALDPKTTHELHEDLLKIWRDTKVTVVMVSHLIEEATSLADRVVLMKDGEIEEIFSIPLPYPRRENGLPFHDLVLKIRKQFFV